MYIEDQTDDADKGVNVMGSLDAYAVKAGEGTVSLVKDVLKDVVSEAIKKALFGG